MNKNKSCLVIVYFDQNGINHCGSDHTHITNLKTVKGVQKRINSKEYAKNKYHKDYAIIPHYTWLKMNTYMINDYIKAGYKVYTL